MKFENQVLDAQGGDIPVDGNSFVGCLLKNARLVFSGGSFEFSGSRYENVSYLLVGAAANTLAFLKMVGGSPQVGSVVSPQSSTTSAKVKVRKTRRRK